MEGRALVKNIYVDEGSLPNRLAHLSKDRCNCMTESLELLPHSRACVYRVVEEARILILEQRHDIIELTKESGRLQLVVGRYQFMWEAAQLCINKIDDWFEYAVFQCTPEQTQAHVHKHLEIYTEAVSKTSKANV